MLVRIVSGGVQGWSMQAEEGEGDGPAQKSLLAYVISSTASTPSIHHPTQPPLSAPLLANIAQPTRAMGDYDFRPGGSLKLKGDKKK